MGNSDDNEHVDDDVDWTEHNIHEYDDEVEDKNFLFQMFDKGDDELDDNAYEYDFNPTISEKIMLRGNEDMNNSTGLAVWTGSEILCDYLLEHPTLLKDKYIVELGAGVGLCGIVAHKLGAKRVLLTDGDKTVLKNLRYNVQRNKNGNIISREQNSEGKLNDNNDGENNNISREEESSTTTIACPQLIWGKEYTKRFTQKYGHPNVILASDVTYITKSIDPMWQTVHHLLPENDDDALFLFIHRSSSQDPVEVVIDTGMEYGFTATSILSTGVILFQRGGEIGSNNK